MVSLKHFVDPDSDSRRQMRTYCGEKFDWDAAMLEGRTPCQPCVRGVLNLMYRENRRADYDAFRRQWNV